VLHVALLPLIPGEQQQQQQQQQRCTACKLPEATMPSAAAASPLLFMPVLVLPAAAAQEPQQHWQQAAAAADGLEDVWGQTIAPMTRDIAYFLFACQDATKAAAAATQTATYETHAAAASQVSGGVVAVLQQLLTHLAACGLWSTMQLLIECAQNYVAAAAASPAGSSMATASSAGSNLSVTSCTDNSAHDAASCSSRGTFKPASASNEQQQLSGVSRGAASAAHPSLGGPFAGLAVPVTSLLWGFEGRQVEDSYQAAAFSSSGPLDVASLLFEAAMGVGCYFVKGGSQQQ
jgi:hypothetical protein